MTIQDADEAKKPLELKELLVVQTHDGSEVTFECVGVLQDPDTELSYAVLMHEDEGEEEGEFVVTDAYGNLLEDDELAQDILDDFLSFAQEAGD
ncbi:MAG: hypothetical protein ACYDA1_01220 [Vulcanimicrobiaceae bacterium]